MQLLAHRGYWNDSIKPNSADALFTALEKGYGIETDFRDCNNEMVIAHDPPAGNNLLMASDFFKKAADYPFLPLALNIKSDGLQLMVKSALQTYGIENYFVFDASLPDLYKYSLSGIKYYSRVSDLEPEPLLYNNADGIWLDAFVDEWYTMQIVEQYLNAGKKVSIVSPELHKREYLALWNKLLSLKGHIYFKHILLCTDFPDQAKTFFQL